MNEFISSIVKFAVICYAAILFFLIGFVVLLIIAPKFLLKFAYFVLLAACVIAIVYLLVGLISIILICSITKKKYNKETKTNIIGEHIKTEMKNHLG